MIRKFLSICQFTSFHLLEAFLVSIQYLRFQRWPRRSKRFCVRLQLFEIVCNLWHGFNLSNLNKWKKSEQPYHLSVKRCKHWEVHDEVIKISLLPMLLTNGKRIAPQLKDPGLHLSIWNDCLQLKNLKCNKVINYSSILF